MRIFVAALRTETNSFVPHATTLADFRTSAYVAAGEGSLDGDAHPGYAALLACARAAGADIVRGAAAAATPGGVVAAGDYAILRDEVLAALTAAAPVDIVLLDLHGAMAAEGEPDCEGDLLAAARAIAGAAAKIGALLDPHATLSERMLEAADILVAYKEYPHTDIRERAQELFALTVAAWKGAIRPVFAVTPLRALGGFATVRSPMRDFVRSMQDDEKAAGVLSVSLIHGFPWADSADNGAKMLVYTDGDRQRAQVFADAAGARFTAIRDQAAQTHLGVADCIARIRAEPQKRFIVADACDNPGGGGDGDSTHLLAPLWASGIAKIGAALINDAAALESALQAGIGAELTLPLGGKLSRYSGAPLVVSGRVAGIAQSVSPPLGAAPGAPIGPIVRFATACGDLILTGRRREALWPGLFTQTGARIEDYRVIVVKSSNHFRAGFANRGDEVLSVASATAMNPNLAALPFKHLPRPMWPLDEMPGAHLEGEHRV
ncbi:MAG: M81 family metallopeptidase [Hyphomonadaceae bacterium]|nr:M81 family metallopeptidase [Hyphomonadaceae bacterium]